MKNIIDIINAGFLREKCNYDFIIDSKKVGDFKILNIINKKRTISLNIKKNNFNLVIKGFCKKNPKSGQEEDRFFIIRNEKDDKSLIEYTVSNKEVEKLGFWLYHKNQNSKIQFLCQKITYFVDKEKKVVQEYCNKNNKLFLVCKTTFLKGKAFCKELYEKGKIQYKYINIGNDEILGYCFYNNVKNSYIFFRKNYPKNNIQEIKNEEGYMVILKNQEPISFKIGFDKNKEFIDLLNEKISVCEKFKDNFANINIKIRQLKNKNLEIYTDKQVKIPNNQNYGLNHIFLECEDNKSHREALIWARDLNGKVNLLLLDPYGHILDKNSSEDKILVFEVKLKSIIQDIFGTNQIDENRIDATKTYIQGNNLTCGLISDLFLGIAGNLFKNIEEKESESKDYSTVLRAFKEVIDNQINNKIRNNNLSFVMREQIRKQKIYIVNEILKKGDGLFRQDFLNSLNELIQTNSIILNI